MANGYHWIQTWTGKKFSIDNPDLESICIEDIAHALSLQCRFNGHVNDFLSVAQHSVMVCDWVFMQRGFFSKNNLLWALLHDATEAYIGDVVKPLKVRLPDYNAIEKQVELAIINKFGLSPTMPDIVKRGDKAMLLSEKRDLFNVQLPWTDDDPTLELEEERIRCWIPREAEKTFLNLYRLIAELK